MFLIVQIVIGYNTVGLLHRICDLCQSSLIHCCCNLTKLPEEFVESRMKRASAGGWFQDFAYNKSETLLVSEKSEINAIEMYLQQARGMTLSQMESIKVFEGERLYSTGVLYFASYCSVKVSAFYTIQWCRDAPALKWSNNMHV